MKALQQIYEVLTQLFSGVHIHIGSQIKDPEIYRKSMNECTEFLKFFLCTYYVERKLVIC